MQLRSIAWSIELPLVLSYFLMKGLLWKMYRMFCKAIFRGRKEVNDALHIGGYSEVYPIQVNVCGYQHTPLFEFELFSADHVWLHNI